MWIEAHTTLRNHPKLRKLQKRLDLDTAQAVGHLILLWLWATDYALDGDLSGHDPEDIALAAEFDGDPQTFIEALIACGLIDAQGDSRRLHDWHDYADKLIAHRENGQRGNHERWHVQRNRSMPGCRFCEQDGIGGDSGGDIGGDSPKASGANPPTNQPDLPNQPHQPHQPASGDAEIEETCAKAKAALLEDFTESDLQAGLSALRDKMKLGEQVNYPSRFARACAEAAQKKRLVAERAKVPLVVCESCGCAHRENEDHVCEGAA